MQDPKKQKSVRREESMDALTAGMFGGKLTPKKSPIPRTVADRTRVASTIDKKGYAELAPAPAMKKKLPKKPK